MLLQKNVVPSKETLGVLSELEMGVSVDILWISGGANKSLSSSELGMFPLSSSILSESGEGESGA